MRRFLWALRFWLWHACHFGMDTYSFEAKLRLYDERINNLKWLEDNHE